MRKKIYLIFFIVILLPLILMLIFLKKTYYDVIVIGGGLSGLSAAYELKGYDILLLEKSERLGGRVYTIYINDTVVDLGSIFAIQDFSFPFEFDRPKIILEDNPIGVFFGKKINLCKSILECVNKLELDENEKEEIVMFHNSSISIDDLSNDSYKLLNSLFKTIYPGEIKDYLPQFQKTVFEGVNPIYYVTGNSIIIEELLKRIKADISLSSTVFSVEDEGRRVKVNFEKDRKQREVFAKAVIVATSGDVANWIVKTKNQESADFLNSLRYGAITTVALGVKSGEVANLSCVLTNGLALDTIYKLKRRNGVDVLIVYYGDEKSRKIYNMTDDVIVSLTIDEINKIGIGNLTKKNIVFNVVKRWKTGGTIISSVSYGDWSEKKIMPSERIFLAGDYTWVNNTPYGMNAAIQSGKAAAEKVKGLLGAGN